MDFLLKPSTILLRLRAPALLFAGACALGSLLSPGEAQAQACNFGISNVSFGNIDTTANVPFDTSSTMTVTCSGVAGRTVRVCPNIGDGSGGSNSQGSPRILANGANQLTYSLYRDAARTQVWGSWVWPWAANFPAPQIDLVLGSNGTVSTSVPIYARVFAAQQTDPPGNYTSSFSGGHTLMSFAYSTAGSCTQIAGAGGVQSGFNVTATNMRNCTLSAAPLAFGTTGALTANVDATSSIRVTCSQTVAYTVGLDGGIAAALSPTARKMRNGANTITYGIYGDAARTQGWFNTGAFFMAAGVGSGLAQTFSVYGRVPPQTTPLPGTYSDTVVVTLTY